jgi:ABC-type multidrug transport system ATPase subunit
MSILTGLFPPSSGTAYIAGYDIRTDIDKVREGLGICPQHNVLFDKLTVQEHLWFCAKLRRMKDDDARQRIAAGIKDVGLVDKTDVPASSLSGGQKRKLSVAMAFLCGKHTVILDEPTAGMDPSARRSTWDLLLRYKKHMTILLCSHHLDEADLLSDHICILAHGKLQCCGSSLFLKRAYEASYVLSLEVDRSKGVEAAELLGAVKGHVDNATLADDVGQEVSINLPASRTAAFGPLLRDLEERRERLGLLSSGMSATTLEDVFLKVAEAAEYAEDGESGREPSTNGISHFEQDRQDGDELELIASRSAEGDRPVVNDGGLDAPVSADGSYTGTLLTGGSVAADKPWDGGGEGVLLYSGTQFYFLNPLLHRFALVETAVQSGCAEAYAQRTARWKGLPFSDCASSRLHLLRNGGSHIVSTAIR